VVEKVLVFLVLWLELVEGVVEFSVYVSALFVYGILAVDDELRYL
jgi:hypothetical protein